MSLAAGVRLGPYEVVAPIGAGGMGEVYRARDVRLDRVVAIKTLPSHLADQPARRDRFEREARAVAALNHPNIATLHDIGVEGDIQFIAMEFVEGESLAQRLEKGPLPLAQALRYTAEIADALNQAHRHGITHRDLKPNNIMLTKGGAKLLDFGLAKMHNLESSPAFAIPIADFATTPAPLTIEGAILGTVHYMAPEQLLGKAVDARTDIFALGAVVHEMLTGEKAFSGKTAVSLMVSIMEHEPVSIPSLVPSVPLTVSQLVRKCLAKDPEDRWQSAQDLRDTVRLLLEPGQEAVAPAIRSLRWRSLITGFLALAVLVFSLASLLRGPDRSADLTEIRFSIDAPAGTFFSGAPADLAISPNGHYVVFGALDKDGNHSLWLRPMGSFDADARRLNGTEDAFSPFWSSDSKQIAFFKGGKLVRLAVAGEANEEVHTICEDVTDGRGGSWNKDDVIVFAPNLTGPLYRISLKEGGAARPITTLDQHESGHIWPQILPDNDHFIYLAWSGQNDERHIRMDSLRTKDSQVILAADSNVSFALGRLIFSRGGKLLEQLFDPSAGKPTGEPFTISADVWRNPGTGRSAFAVSPSGDVVYRNGTNFGATQLVIWDRKKKEVRSRLVNPTEDGYGNPVVSPDGKWIALDVQDYKKETRNISMSALDKWDPLPVTSRQSNDSSPLWSWDSRQMLYLSNRDKPTVFRIDREDGKPEMIFQEDGILNIQDRSELHQSIIFEKADPQTKRDLWVYSEKEGKARQFLHGEHNEMHGQVSPDGKWIVYASDENDKYDIYIQKFPEGGPKKQISRGGGIQPKWNRNGNEVFYLAPDRGLMAVAIDSDTGAPKDKPTLLVKTAVNSPNALHARNNYSVLPDGEAFVINSVVDSGKPINVILNWKRR